MTRNSNQGGIKIRVIKEMIVHYTPVHASGRNFD